VIRIRSFQEADGVYVEKTMSLVTDNPGRAIPNATAAAGEPVPPPRSFQNSINPLPPARTSGDFPPVAPTSST
jgi:hypothetical protein